MKWLISKFKSAKWIGWVVLAGAVAVLTLLVRGLFQGPKTPGKRLPDVPEKLKAKVEKAEEDALVARVRAQAEAEEAEKRIEEIAKEDDGAARREKLAEYLRTL